MPYPKFSLTLLILMLIATPIIRPSAASPDVTGLILAWVEQGNLTIRIGEDTPKSIVSGEVNRPYIAPDGKHIAFTRGVGGIAQSLWVVALDGADAREMVSADALRSADGRQMLISDVAWLDDTTLYFNTAGAGAFGLERVDDLWQVNIDTGEVKMMLSPGEGGAFSISPDAKHIAIIFPGAYGKKDGRIHLINSSSSEDQDLLSFTGVSTGADYSFYPEVFWEADSSALRVAIPDKDLVYDDVNSPPVTLWRLGIGDSQERLGSVQASFFGLPRWSDDGSHMLFLRRSGDRTSNHFDLILANGKGDEQIIYASGEAGSIGAATWIPDSARFIFPHDEPGVYALGGVGVKSSLLPVKPMFSPQFVDDKGIIYATAPADSFDLHYLNLNDLTSISIAAIHNPLPMFDLFQANP